MTDTTAPEWRDDGTTIARGRQFGAWEVSQIADLEAEGVVLSEPIFYGPAAPGYAEGTILTGIQAARDAARQLLAAADYAESALGV